MLFSIKNREDFEILEELASLRNQVEELHLQEKLGKRNFHENVNKLLEPLIDTIKNISENLTKTITETYINNNKAIENSNENILELMNDKSMIAPYLASSLVNLLKPENKSQFRLIRDVNSTKMNDFLINTNVPIILYSNMSTFRDTKRSSKLDGDLLKTMISYKFNVDHSNPQDKIVIYEFGKEMRFDIKQKGRPSNRDKSMIKNT